MPEELYQKELMRLAGSAHGAGRLPHPDGSATIQNPLCGDRITVDVTRDATGRITALAHDAKACVLCQASAALLAGHAIGSTAADIAAEQQLVRDLLTTGALPDHAWPGLSAFAPVAKHRNRHRCVLLPFEATEAALTSVIGTG